MIFEKTVNIFAKNGTLKRFRANETNLQIIQGKISSIISEKEIEELTSGDVTMYTKLGQVTQTASELKTSFSNFKTEYDKTEKDYTEFKKSTSEHVQTAEKFENTVTDYMKQNDETVKNVESKAEQTAGQFKWLVKSGTSETDFTLTDRTTELLTENLIIKNKDGSKTIISGGKMDVEDVLTQNLVVKNKDGSQTLISGGTMDIEEILTQNLVVKNKDGQTTIISGGKIDLDEIFAQDITASGTIRGVTLVGAEIGAKRIIATKEFALSCNSDADVERVLYYDGTAVRIGKLLNAAGAQSGAGFEFVGAATITAYGNLNMYSGNITSPGTIQGKSVKATADLSGATIKSLGEIIANSNVKSGDNFLLDNGHGVYAKDTGGSYRDVVTLSAGGNTTLGFGLYNVASGSTRIYGNKIAFISKIPEKEWSPCHYPGTSTTISFEGAGFITTSMTEVRFTVPISRPIFSNTAAIHSTSGLIIRQAGKYCYGSAASTWVRPSSYSAEVCNDFVVITAKFANTTNVTLNNEACGVAAKVQIVF